MISYYGSKQVIAKHYPKPLFNKIIEPFAGAAWYSLLHWENDVILVDMYEPIINVWKYLQNASPQDIDRLPILETGQKLSDFDLSPEERNFMSFCVNMGVATPRNTLTKRAARSFKHRIKQTKEILPKIKHWKIIHGNAFDIPNQMATWFIDPPYQNGGKHYKHNNIDYELLASWAKERHGQVIVCEHADATWLDFKPLVRFKGNRNSKMEGIFHQINNQPSNGYKK
jgi:hypothetical protein